MNINIAMCKLEKLIATFLISLFSFCGNCFIILFIENINITTYNIGTTPISICGSVRNCKITLFFIPII